MTGRFILSKLKEARPCPCINDCTRRKMTYLKQTLSDLAVFQKNLNSYKRNSDLSTDLLLRFIHQNGSTVWARSRIMHIRGPEGEVSGFLGFVVDISQEKAKDENLNQTNKMLRATLESFKEISIYSIDREYRYITFNDRYQSAIYTTYGTMVVRNASLKDSISHVKDWLKEKFNCDKALAGEAHTTVEAYGERACSFCNRAC